MSNNRPPLAVILVVLLLIISAGAYYFFFANRPVTVDTSVLSASGTVETAEISVAPELAGKVIEVNVSEGDVVKAGDVLFRLDGSLLQAQKNIAAASLETAKAASVTAEAAAAAAQTQYDSALTVALNEDKTNRIADWTKSKPTDFNQPSWYFSKAEQRSAVQAEGAAAQENLTKAEDNLKFVEQKSTSESFLAAEERLGKARVAFQLSQDLLTSTNSATDGQDLKDEAQNIVDDAKSELTDAQKAYDDALTTQGATDVLQARAKLLVAQERLALTQDKLRSYETGSQAPKVVAAQKTLDQANAAAAQAKTAIGQAEANLALIEAQLAKLTVTAPANGVILTRNVEPGEVVNPGSLVLSLSRLSDLTITVYIPEDRYGEVALGQTASVTVDSYAGVTFTATVIHISDQAEFTPRNVQTAEGRKSTVFAIKLRVDDPQSQLKPGMPADVSFK
jgi:HlyD family secretion protein